VTDMIGGGAVQAGVNLFFRTLPDDRDAGAAFLGGGAGTAVAVGGVIEQGAFHSNRTRDTEIVGKAFLTLPVLADADPAQFDLDAFELDLQPDGFGGYDGLIRGGVSHAQVEAAVLAGLTQMIGHDFASHVVLAALVDRDRDGSITPAEVEKAFPFPPDIT